MKASPLSKVNFFVIGAAKCGTTTLYARLRSHPEVFLSPMKEPNYYSRRDIDPSKFSPAFKANTRLDHGAYLKLDDPLPERQVGFIETKRSMPGSSLGPTRSTVLWENAARPTCGPSRHLKPLLLRILLPRLW